MLLLLSFYGDLPFSHTDMGHSGSGSIRGGACAGIWSVRAARTWPADRIGRAQIRLPHLQPSPLPLPDLVWVVQRKIPSLIFYLVR
jgi:hypothetical protein